MNVRNLFVMAGIFCILNVSAETLHFECSTNRKDAIYKAGEKVIFTVKMTEDGKPASGKFIKYRLFHDNNIVEDGQVVATNELKIETSSDKAGWIHVQVWAADAGKKFIRQPVVLRGKTVQEPVTGGIGAMVEPEKLYPTMKEPDDFDAFWNKVKEELAAVPMKELEKVPFPDEKVKIYDVKIACAGEKPVSGYLCVPMNAKIKSCPAIVCFHPAGVRSSRKPVEYALKGLIALDVNAHGIENGKQQKFYVDLRKNYYYVTHDKFRVSSYAHWNKHDRDYFYFKWMYMRLMRALEYVKSLPEWDGKHLIVFGRSQGGAQVLAACAFDHDITFAQADVPAMCDHSGCLADRQSGWPELYTKKDFQENPAYAKCASYFDGAYFARRIHCPIWINTGFMDTVCSPTSVFAAYNSLPPEVEKHIQTCPTGGHDTPHPDGVKAVNDYINAILTVTNEK